MKLKVVLSFLILLVAQALVAQQISIKTGKKSIALNETFQIQLVVRNGEVKSKGDFPTITGFTKGSISQSQSFQYINGRNSSSITYTQHYAPKKVGTFKLKPFSISVNGKETKSPGVTITVGPEKYTPRNNPRSRNTTTYKDLENNTKLKLKINKTEVYRGEPIYATVFISATEQDIALMRFPDDISAQYTKMINEIKVSGAWIEDVEKEIDLNNWEKQTKNGETTYTLNLGELLIYPQKAGDMEIPALRLALIRYRVGNGRDFFGRTIKGDGYKQGYRTRARTIKVKELPPHPLRENVAVGSYKLKETLSDETVNQGEGFVYEFQIRGAGNIGFISKPQVQANGSLEFYDPVIKQNSKIKNGQMAGYKTFTYDIVAAKAGKKELKDFIEWTFFNPKTGKYTTLTSNKTININAVDAVATSNGNDCDQDWSEIQNTSDRLILEGGIDWLKIYVNILLFLILAAILIILWKGKKING